MLKRAVCGVGIVTILSAHSIASTNDVSLLWRDPGAHVTLEFRDDPGLPQPAPPFRFVAESMAGSTPKIRIADANGVEWMVKFGAEVRPQVFAARMAWALGYFALPIYFVPHGTIDGVRRLERAARYVHADGSFSGASFQEYVHSDVRWLSDATSWNWNANPFVGTPQLNALKLLVMLLSDWDNKDARNRKFGSNTAILKYANGEEHYLVSDWGGSMGTWGGYLDRSKWNCTGFSLQTNKFVKAGPAGTLIWGYTGQHTNDFTENISREDVRWFVSYAERITDAQLHDALLSSGATPAQAGCFTKALRSRITHLQALDRP